MLFQIKTINGQKTIVPLTADAGAGAPVGSYLYLEKKSNPQGYLYCDGSTFDETAYPALYQYLGTNVLPDWRELGAKGAEKNTTLIFDSTETDPRTGQAGTQNHDVFAQGEFKDDQIQNHSHYYPIQNTTGYSRATLVGNTNDSTLAEGVLVCSGSGLGGVVKARNGDVTRGKSRAVFIYIKATSGLTENQQENVLNTINENNSYSTEEHPTGAKWIDGKPIYEKTVVAENYQYNTYINDVLDNPDTVIKYDMTILYVNSTVYCGNMTSDSTAYISEIMYYKNANKIYYAGGNARGTLPQVIFSFRYTKTTD